MRKTLMTFLVVGSLILGSTAVMAVGSGKTLEARRATGAVTIDGDLKEFLTPAPSGLQIGVIDTKGSTLEQGVIDDDNDFSGKFYALYDDKYIYMGFDVKDDVVMGSQSDGNIYQNDTAELWFDADNDDVTSTECGSEEPDQHQIGVTVSTADEPGVASHYVWRSQDTADLMDGLKEAAKLVKGGYTFEVAIPIAALHGSFTTVKPGQKLAFNLSMVDNDEGDWNHITWNGTLHSDPQQFGILAIK